MFGLLERLRARRSNQIQALDTRPIGTQFNRDDGVSMNRPVVRLSPLLLALMVAGCSEATTPEGESTQVTVRAFVDANGSGVFDAGDAAIAGAQISLTPSNGEAGVTAATDASGVATFNQVEPGSYAAALTGNVPAGAVLATASAPIVVAPFRGGTVNVEFRYVYNPGGVSGRLYRDDNGNGQYDASDTPAPGLIVRLFSSADTLQDPVSETATGNAGEFSFSGLRPGAYTLVVTSLPTMQLEGGNVRTVTVGAEGTANLAVRFTGNLIISIDDARDNNPLDSALVAVEGVVTAGVGIYNARSFYMQDATGGVLVFGVDTALVKPQPGDRVRVVGRMIAFNDELEIILPTVTKIGTTTVPTPRTVTAAQINSFAFQGELGRTTSLRVDTVGGTGTATAYDVITRDLAGNRLVVRVSGTGVNIPRAFWQVGTRYDVTGILNRFRATGQLAPRSQADVQAALVPVSIASAKTRAIGSRVSVVGVVTAPAAADGPFGARTFYLQDLTSGIMAFFSPSGTAVPVALGDSVQVTGIMNQFSGELEVDSISVTTLRSGTTVPAPRVNTGAQIVARTFEGELLRVNNVTVLSVQTGTSAAFNVTVRDAAGTEFVVRVGGAGTGLTRANFTVNSQYDIIGVLGSFNGAAQHKPRSASDVIAR